MTVLFFSLLLLVLLLLVWVLRRVLPSMEEIERTNPRRRAEEVPGGEIVSPDDPPLEIETGSSVVAEARVDLAEVTNLPRRKTPPESPTEQPNPTIPRVLGYPALLKPVYDKLKDEPVKDKPGKVWDHLISPIDISVFDSPLRLREQCLQLPVIETPVFAMEKLASMYPEKLQAMGISFFAGNADHPPFAFVARREDPDEEKRTISAEDLVGKAVSVLGTFMSPTAILCEALNRAGIAVKALPLDRWKEREPSLERVDLQVDTRLDGQLHALEVGEVDYALLIFPYTRDLSHRLAGTGELVCHVSVEPLERQMGEFLESRPLNALVTWAEWYQENGEWKKSVDELVEAVERKNKFLNEQAGSKGIAPGRGEVLFKAQGLHHTDVEALRQIRPVGVEIGLLPPARPGKLDWVAA